MLQMDMTLDADLGIDSIKRVEILSALQDRLPDAPAVKPEHLGSLHTLRQLADFLAGPVGQAAALAATPGQARPLALRRDAAPDAGAALRRELLADTTRSATPT